MTHKLFSDRLSGKIRRQSAPFLWCVLMGMSDKCPDEDNLLHCAFMLDKVNKLLCDPISMNEKQLDSLQSTLFDFGSTFAAVFRVDISTKLHRLMRHVKHHIVHLGCLRRCSSEENEESYKQFKSIVENTNRHMHYLASQLLNVWVGRSQSFTDPDIDISDPNYDDPDTSITVHDEQISVKWSDFVCTASSIVDQLSGSCTPADVSQQVLQLKFNGSFNCKSLKAVRFPTTVAQCSSFMYKTLFGGDNVYGRSNRHDAVFATVRGQQTLGLVETVFAVRCHCKFTSVQRLVLLRLLTPTATVHGNHKVDILFGHKRFTYDRSQYGHIHVALVPATSLLRPAMVVVDHYWIKQTYGLSTTTEHLRDDQQTQMSMAFFLVNGFNIYRRRQRIGNADS